MRNIPKVLKLAAVAVIFGVMAAVLSSSASAEFYNSAKIDGEVVLLTKDGTRGAGAGNAANASDAQRGAMDDAAGYTTFPYNICFAPAVKHGNILLLSSSQTFTVCMQGPKPKMVHPPRPGGLPLRVSSVGK